MALIQYSTGRTSHHEPHGFGASAARDLVRLRRERSAPAFADALRGHAIRQRDAREAAAQDVVGEGVHVDSGLPS